MKPASFEVKIMDRDACVAWRQALPDDCKVVFTNGVFDLLHRGHVSYLDEASQLGDVLVLGLNSDASVRRLNKGPERPLNTQEDRAAVLAALSSISAVTIFDEENPCALIEMLRPDLIVKGGDYDMEALPETRLVRSWGGDALALSFAHDRSTTTLVRKIRASAD